MTNYSYLVDNPRPGTMKPNIDRFMKKVEFSDEHWLWVGGTSSGYGVFWDNEAQRLVRAHIWSYEYFVGPVPDGYEVHHQCKYRNCVAPGCLQPLSKPDHYTTRNYHTATHCPKGHPYDDTNTLTSVDSVNGNVYVHKRCAVCTKESKKRYRQNNKEKRAEYQRSYRQQLKDGRMLEEL